jgi:hypothetical protein
MPWSGSPPPVAPVLEEKAKRLQTRHAEETDR